MTEKEFLYLECQVACGVIADKSRLATSTATNTCLITWTDARVPSTVYSLVDDQCRRASSAARLIMTHMTSTADMKPHEVQMHQISRSNIYCSSHHDTHDYHSKHRWNTAFKLTIRANTLKLGKVWQEATNAAGLIKTNTTIKTVMTP